MIAMDLQQQQVQAWALYLSIAAASILIFLKLTGRLHRRRLLNLPPGPRPWPVIGNFNLIGPLPHRSIHALSLKYGPLMHIRFGSTPVVVGSTVEAARFFLKTHDLVFASRPRTAAGKYTTYNYSDITWSPYGAYWRQARKMCLTELFSAKRLDSYEYIRAEELRKLLHDMFESSSRTVSLKDMLSTLSLNVISRMVLGRKYLEEEVEVGTQVVTPEEFKAMLDELFLLNGVLNLGDWIPWIDFLDVQGYVRRMKAVSKKFDAFLEHVLDEHNARRKEDGEAFLAKDMVDVLLQIADDPAYKLSRDGVKAFTQVPTL